MARNWLQMLDEALSGYSTPKERLSRTTPKLGTEYGAKDGWRNYSFEPMSAAERNTALRENPNAISWSGDKDYNPYARDDIGYYKERAYTRNDVGNPSSWTDTQSRGRGPITRTRYTGNRVVDAAREINSLVNRNINRGAMAAANLLPGKVGNQARRAIRNTAREDAQLLPGRGNRSYPSMSYPYRDAMDRAREAEQSLEFFPYTTGKIDALDPRTSAIAEADYQRALANSLKPSLGYRAIRGAIKAAPIIGAGALAYGAIGKRAKEPICDCGKPESKCTCSNHNHAKGKSGKVTKARKPMRTIYGENNKERDLGLTPESRLHFYDAWSPKAAERLSNDMDNTKWTINLKYGKEPAILESGLSPKDIQSLFFQRQEKKRGDKITGPGSFGQQIARYINGYNPAREETYIDERGKEYHPTNSGMVFFNSASDIPGGRVTMGSGYRSTAKPHPSRGSQTTKRLSKAMDMRTKSPKIPSTKRDVRHTDKYFR